MDDDGLGGLDGLRGDGLGGNVLDGNNLDVLDDSGGDHLMVWVEASLGLNPWGTQELSRVQPQPASLPPS